MDDFMPRTAFDITKGISILNRGGRGDYAVDAANTAPPQRPQR